MENNHIFDKIHTQAHHHITYLHPSSLPSILTMMENVEKVLLPTTTTPCHNDNGGRMLVLLSLPTDVLGCVVSFLSEVDLYRFEDSYYPHNNDDESETSSSTTTQTTSSLTSLLDVTKKRWYELCVMADTIPDTNINDDQQHGHHPYYYPGRSQQQHQQQDDNDHHRHHQNQQQVQDCRSKKKLSSSSPPSRWGPFLPISVMSLPDHNDDDGNDRTRYMNIARQRGREYCEAILFARQITTEAAFLYDFGVGTNKENNRNHNTKNNNSIGSTTSHHQHGRHHHHHHHQYTPDMTTTTTIPSSISPCWVQEWYPPIVRGHQGTGRGGVYLNLSLLDGTNRVWEGYRTITHVSFTESIVSIDVRTLVDEMRWTELSSYHDMYVRGGHEGALRDHHGSALQLEALMRPLQITIISSTSSATTRNTSSVDPTHRTEQGHQQYGLILSTGGFQSADVAYDGYLSSGAFQDRCPRFPLGMGGGAGTKSSNNNSTNTKKMTDSSFVSDVEGPYRTWMRISSDKVIFRMERPFLIL